MQDLRQLSRAMRALELTKCVQVHCMLKDTNAHLGQGPILDYVANNPNCTQAEIAEYMGISAASVACSVRRMEHAGLINRSADEKDQRCNRLMLTKKGSDTAIDVRLKLDGLDKRMFDGFDDEELAKLGEYYGRMLANLSNNGEVRTVPQLIKELRNMEDK